MQYCRFYTTFQNHLGQFNHRLTMLNSFQFSFFSVNKITWVKLNSLIIFNQSERLKGTVSVLLASLAYIFGSISKHSSSHCCHHNSLILLLVILILVNRPQSDEQIFDPAIKVTLMNDNQAHMIMSYRVINVWANFLCLCICNIYSLSNKGFEKNQN